jgi:hypothetical protein
MEDQLREPEPVCSVQPAKECLGNRLKIETDKASTRIKILKTKNFFIKTL